MNILTSVAAIAATGLVLIAGPAAQAQTATDGQADMVQVYTDADAQAVLNARIAALKTVLDLTPDQEKLWPPVEASIRKIAADSMTRGKSRSEADSPSDFLQALDRIAESESARAADLRSFVAAARPLVDALTEEQKNRAPAFLGMFVDPDQPLSTRSLWLFEEEER